MLSCISWIADILALILIRFLHQLYPGVSDMIYAFTDRSINRQSAPLKQDYPSEKPLFLNIYKPVWPRYYETEYFQRTHHVGNFHL